jgi:hypothetical protein
MSDLERFMSKVDKRGDDECWEWQAGKNPRGYGQFSFKGRQKMAHRVIWILTNGPIPAGFFICHKCDNPSCVNPAHLFPGTPLDNTRDCISKGRFLFSTRKARIYCPNGHLYAGDNLYITPDGERKCRTCRSNQNRLRYQRMKKEGAIG